LGPSECPIQPIYPSDAMGAVASRLVHKWLRCETRPTLGAMLRIAYDSGQRTELERYQQMCMDALRAANRLASDERGATDGENCAVRGYLATDWFVGADPVRYNSREQARLAEQANQQCWVEEMQNTSAVTWLWPADIRMLSPIIAAVPWLLHPHGKSTIAPTAPIAAPNLFRAYLDLAVLTKVDRCFVFGHMGNMASNMRENMGRPRCIAR